MRRGEIYFVPLDPIIGQEQGGTRPVLVVSIDTINSAPLVVTVVPGTDGRNVRIDRQHSVRVAPDDSGLPRETVFLCFQARALDKSRFPLRPAGVLSTTKMLDVEKALAYVFGL